MSDFCGIFWDLFLLPKWLKFVRTVTVVKVFFAFRVCINVCGHIECKEICLCQQ